MSLNSSKMVKLILTKFSGFEWVPGPDNAVIGFYFFLLTILQRRLHTCNVSPDH